MTALMKHNMIHRRGFTTILAVSMIALMGMAITAMMWRLTHEAAGQRQARRQAELRQLLLAGAAASPQLVAHPRDSVQVSLPAHLTSERAGFVTLRPGLADSDLERLVLVEAGLDGAVIHQTLRYVRGQQGWGLVQATLGKPKPEAPADRDDPAPVSEVGPE